MIRLMQAAEAHSRSDVLDAMFRMRAAIFHERMQWPVTVVDGKERDRFDDLNPLYVLVVDEAHVLRASARLLPTTGPTMLGDVFRDLLPEGQVISSTSIWESSRFSVMPSEGDHYARQLNQVTGELLAGIVETGIRAGLEFVVTVMDVSVERVLRRAGCPCERLGSPKRIGRSLSVVGLFEMSDRLLSSIREASGVKNGLFSADLQRLGLAA